MCIALLPSGEASPASFSRTASSSRSETPSHLEMIAVVMDAAPYFSRALAAVDRMRSSEAVSSEYRLNGETSGRRLPSSCVSSAMRASSVSR
jgi:hypothetical protein